MIQAVDGIVFVGVPERAAVGVKRHCAVVAPARADPTAAVSLLRAGALKQQLLGLCNAIDRVSRQSSGVLQRRVSSIVLSAPSPNFLIICQIGKRP